MFHHLVAPTWVISWC